MYKLYLMNNLCFRDRGRDPMVQPIDGHVSDLANNAAEYAGHAAVFALCHAGLLDTSLSPSLHPM